MTLAIIPLVFILLVLLRDRQTGKTALLLLCESVATALMLAAIALVATGRATDRCARVWTCEWSREMQELRNR
jgi:hypothetical protein